MSISGIFLSSRWQHSLPELVSFSSVDRLNQVHILTAERSMDFTSTAESSSLMAPPVQSVISTLKSSPALTSATWGTWGCQRLWRGNSCSHGFFVKSMGTTSLGVEGAMDELKLEEQELMLIWNLLFLTYGANWVSSFGWFPCMGSIASTGSDDVSGGSDDLNNARH